MTLKSDLCRKFLISTFMKRRKFFNIVYSNKNALIIKTHENWFSIWKMFRKALMFMSSDLKIKRKLIICLSWNDEKENDFFKC